MNILEVENVVKSYAEHTALKGVSLEVPQGVIYGLLGPNGAGKTSLIRIINQITAPDSGSVRFLGQPLNPNHIADIGYLPEERGLYKKMKIGDQLLYLAQLKGLSQAEAMEKLKKWFIKFDIKPWWDKKLEDLSKGMAQKIQFVATVMHQPKLIILDEPFTGFDPVNANLIKDEILELRNQGSTIIFSTHRMESVEELCDHIALINKSEKVLDGTKAAIKAQFAKPIYEVTYSGTLPELSEQFQVMETIEKGSSLSKILMKDRATPNELITQILPKVDIINFVKNEPTMNDIFIQVVSQNSAL